MKRIKILLIEDNRILFDGIKALISAQPDLSIVAVPRTKYDIVQHVRTKRPHVVLMDLGLRNENCLHLVSTLAGEFPDIRIIGMGLIPSRNDIVEFVEAGAAGFILKDATIKDVLGTIRSVAKGTNVLPAALTESLFTHVVERALLRGRGILPVAARMTRREREIVVLIAEGMSNKEIAERLSLSPFTIKSHIHNILEKMALHSRLQIAAHFHD